LKLTPKIVAVDLAAGGEARSGAAVRVWAEAVHLEDQRYRLGHAADGEVAVDDEVVPV